MLPAYRTLGKEVAMAETVGIVGAGFMGSGIAESAARGGYDVILHEPDAAVLARSRSRIEQSLLRAAEAGKLEGASAESVLARITPATELAAVSGAQLVVEAVYEDAQVKAAVFRELDRLLPPEIPLASNTSSIPIARLAAATAHPERVLGLHFFSPVPVMRLVEVVISLDTASEIVERAERFVVAIGKQSIRTKDRSGFVVNLLLVPYLMAAVRMLEEGFASAHDIDLGMKLGAGHPMGPLTLCDFIGLDVLQAVCDSLYEEFKRPDFAAPPMLKRLVEAGHHGRKSGRGFYDYAG
jgi:3-hydroxybutyryl-CoA dehydrogenase